MIRKLYLVYIYLWLYTRQTLYIAQYGGVVCAKMSTLGSVAVKCKNILHFEMWVTFFAKNCLIHQENQ